LIRLDDQFIGMARKVTQVNDLFWRSHDRKVKNVGRQDPKLAIDRLSHPNF